MSGTNGKTKTIFVLIGILTAVVSSIIAYNYWFIVPSIANNIIANDIRNVKERNELRAEMIRRDEKIMDSLHRFDVRQEVLIKVVEKIEKKI